jgi:hypothetical protein
MLISCPECNKQISDMAQSCPGCGMPAPSRKGSFDEAAAAWERRRGETISISENVPGSHKEWCKREHHYPLHPIDLYFHASITRATVSLREGRYDIRYWADCLTCKTENLVNKY